MQDTLNLFGLKIPLYGLMISLGVIYLTLLVIYLFRKSGASESRIDQLIIITAISGGMLAAGAAFFDSLWDTISYFRKTGVFEWQEAGITFSGGLLTAFIAYVPTYYIISKNERHKMFFYLDFIVIGIAIAHAFGRLGCFFGGCCHGGSAPVGTFFTMFYPGEINGWENLYMTALYEALFLFILAAVLLFVIKKHRCGLYFILYNIYRFFIEYLRGDERGDSPFGFLTPSQFLAVIMIILGIILIIFRKQFENFLKSKNKNYEEIQNSIQDIKRPTVYENKFLNFLHYNKFLTLIISTMILVLTIISFGIFRDGQNRYTSVEQNKDSEIISEVLNWNNLDNKKLSIKKELTNDNKLVFISTDNNLTYTYIPEDDLAIVSSTDGSTIKYQAMYFYQYHLQKNKEYRTIVEFETISNNMNAEFSNDNYRIKSNTKIFLEVVTHNMSNHTQSIVPVIFLIITILEVLIILAFIVLIYFDNKLNLLNSKYLKEVSNE